MSTPAQDGAQLVERWQDALDAAAVAALRPHGVGGALVRAGAGPIRDAWLSALAQLTASDSPMVKLPPGATEDRVLGGIDLGATLAHGRVVVDSGVLARAHGGWVVVPMAERIEPVAAAHLGGALDRGEVALEREGLSRRLDARIGVIALDEGIDDERVPTGLADRLGIWLNLDGIPPRWSELFELERTAEEVAAARSRVDAVRVSTEIEEALVKMSLALGIASLRAPLFALQAARGHAALVGRDAVGPEDLAFAARLVFAPRATRIPESSEPPPPEPEQNEDDPGEDSPPPESEDTLAIPEDVILAAVEAALPEGLLEALAAGRGNRNQPGSLGVSGAKQRSKLRGRPKGSRAGEPGRDGRIDLVGTLRAAAPWQKLRGGPRDGRIEVRKSDFKVKRYEQRRETLAVFVVDASGSSAFARLAEAKGAVEHLLVDCYSRRDAVALLAFRGEGAELLLPPTRALARAKRCLADLPGGGPTPIAAGLEAGLSLLEEASRRGKTPLLVVMTDGRANVGLDGTKGRADGERDALEAARKIAARGANALLVDTSTRPRASARELAAALGAQYVPLPRAAAAEELSRVVRAAS